MRINKTGRLGSGGFTLAEVMTVIAIIGVLSAIEVPNYLKYRKKSQLAEIVTNLTNFEKGFVAYGLEEGGFPNDCHTDSGPYGLPNTAIEKYIRVDEWVKPTPLGDRYNWEGPDTYFDPPASPGYVGISIYGSGAPQEDFRILDSLFDDGDLSNGKFQLTPNGRYTYMIRQR